MRLLARILVVLCAVTIAACGGGGSKPASAKDQITKVVQQFGAAVSEQDYDKACQLLNKDGDSKLRGIDFNLDNRSCQGGMNSYVDFKNGVDADALKFVKVTSVQVRDTEAQAEISLAKSGQTGTVELTKADGKWLISSPPGF